MKPTDKQISLAWRLFDTDFTAQAYEEDVPLLAVLNTVMDDISDTPEEILALIMKVKLYGHVVEGWYADLVLTRPDYDQHTGYPEIIATFKEIPGLSAVLGANSPECFIDRVRQLLTFQYTYYSINQAQLDFAYEGAVFNLLQQVHMYQEHNALHP